MTLATNSLKGREQEQKKMVFQLRIEIAILGMGRLTEPCLVNILGLPTIFSIYVLTNIFVKYQ